MKPIKPTIKISFSEGYGRIESKDYRQLELLRSMFYSETSIYRKGRKKMIKVYQLTPTGKFNVGFYPELVKKIKDTHHIVVDDSFKKAYRPSFQIDSEKIKNFTGISYLPYQVDAIREMLKRGRGIIELGTSGGKSYICAGAAATIIDEIPQSRILIIVPGLSLVNQLYDDFVDKFHIEETTIFTSTRIEDYDKTKRIVITNSECLAAQISNGNSCEHLLSSDVVIIDECHKINHTTEISKILSRMPTQRRFGLTATLPDPGVNLNNIIGKIGIVIFSKDGKALREGNFVAQLKISMYMLEHTKRPKRRIHDLLKDYQLERQWLMTCQRRNELICALAKRFKNTSLILVDNISYGDTITKMLQDHGVKTQFIKGSTKMEDRKSIQDDMERYDDIVTVAMDRIFSTGISLNNIHNVVFAMIGKSKIKIIQSIGRSLRKNHNKQHASIFDICDNLPWSLKHSEERYQLYKKEVDTVHVRTFTI